MASVVHKIRVASVAISLLWAPSSQADEMLERAANCGDFESCFSVMLLAANPRNSTAIQVAAAKIVELPKPAKGNRAAAREANMRGLAALRNGNADSAIAQLQLAAASDPSDSEVQANLGFAFLKNGRPKEAEPHLKASLAINPRRTSAWAPMADLFAATSDPDRAVAALLLAYEFSDNREQTLIYLQNKAHAADSNTPVFENALQRISERASETVVARSQTEISTRRFITKAEARALILERIRSDPDLRSDPMKKEFMICAIDEPLNEAFRDSSQLEVSTFEKRLSTASAGIKAAIGRNDPSVSLPLLKCVVNSKAFEAAVKNGRLQDSEKPQQGALAITDLDDLRVDFASLDGRQVRLQGVGSYMMDMFMLRKTATDMSPIIIDISKLDREYRRAIIQRCSDIMNACRITIQGRVGRVNYQNGLIAERLEW